MVRARLLVLLACLGWFAPGCADAQHPGEDTASSDDVPRHTSHRHKKKKKKHVAQGDDDDAAPKHEKASGDDDDNSDAPRKKKRPAEADGDDDAPKKPAKKAKKHAGDDDDDDDDDAAAKKRAAAKKAAEEKAAAKQEAKERAKEKAAEEKAAKKRAAEEKAAAKKEAAEEKAAAKKEAEERAAEERAAKKKAAEDDTPKISDDDDDDDDESAAKPRPVKAKARPKTEDDVEPKSKAKAKRGDDDDEAAAKPKLAGKAKAKADDGEDEAKPKSKAVAAKAKAKAKADGDEEDEAKPKPKVVAREDDKPEPPQKPRTIEEDIAVDDPLATAPPVRTASSDEEEDDDANKVTHVAAVVAPKGPALQDRSLTTPQGQIDLHAGLPIGVLSVTDATGMSTSSTSTGLALGVAYGVNEKAELGLDYTLGISPGALEGPITLHGAYALKHGKLDFAGAAALAIDFVDTVNPMTMTTTSSTFASLQLGAWARYHATPTVTLFTGLPALPNATSSVTKLAFPLPVLPYQLQVGLSGGAPIALTLPIGLGYQASAKLYTFASLDLANIRIANTSNAFLFKDFIPVALGGFYQLDALAVGATFADDLKQGFGYLRFELVARYLLH